MSGQVVMDFNRGHGRANKKGVVPVGAPPAIQDMTMLSIDETGPASKARRFKDEGVRAFLHDGAIAISASQMNLILRECSYDRQREIMRQHVEVLADIMKREQWRPKDQIDFARLGDRLILVNGYHRAHAQIESAKTILWSVVIHDCLNEDGVRALYYTFDTNNRVRSSRQILNGVGFSESSGLSREIANALFNAVPFIAAGFKSGVAARDVLTTRVMDRRLAFAEAYIEPARQMESAFSEARTLIKRKLLLGGVASVSLVTFKYQPDRAFQFWEGIAKNDGLRRGDARNTLLSELMTRNFNSGGQHRGVTGAVLAWNAWFRDKELKTIRTWDMPTIAIAGTPFDGRQ
jgi:hypothetical protein